MSSEPAPSALINQSIRSLIADVMRAAAADPAAAYFFVKTLQAQRKAEKVRASWKEQGVHVPPFMIASITNRCNLSCAGCYHRALHAVHENEMSREQLERIISEARELGISIILLAGGEPLLRPEVLEIARIFPEIIFAVFTNGMMADDDWLVNLVTRQRNLIPVFSLEGRREETDARRGAGVHERLTRTMRRLRERGVFFGASITVTSANLDVVTGDALVSDLKRGGCRLFFYVEYVPVKERTGGLVPTVEQRRVLVARVKELRRRFKAGFVAFPGEEDEFGGCLAAGRGFVHVNAAGAVEPCPFAPFSDSNLADMSLKEALASPLLALIRGNHELLKDGAGGCSLWENRALVASLLDSCAHTGGPLPSFSKRVA